MRDSIEIAAWIAGVIAVMVAVTWLVFWAPCGLFAGVSIVDVPARCVDSFMARWGVVR